MRKKKTLDAGLYLGLKLLICLRLNFLTSNMTMKNKELCMRQKCNGTLLLFSSFDFQQLQSLRLEKKKNFGFR